MDLSNCDHPGDYPLYRVYLAVLAMLASLLLFRLFNILIMTLQMAGGNNLLNPGKKDSGGAEQWYEM